MSFIKRPNLPESPVKTAILDKADDEIICFVESFGIEIIFTDCNLFVDSAISTHADINTFYFGGGEILLDKSQTRLYNLLTEQKMNVSYAESSVSGKYPNDCKLNFALLADKLIGKADIADARIKKRSYKILNVKQGYAKCSTCIVNENAIITDDASIKKICDQNGIDALLIGKGDVRLNGHEYGFIGGASALIDKNHLIFFGDITAHRDFESIDCFLKKHSCKYSFLKSQVLTDIGGMIPIKESRNSP